MKTLKEHAELDRKEYSGVATGWRNYRKRPVVIQARCLAETETVSTLEGTMTGNPGDYRIRGVKGEEYFCKPDIFAATYEMAE